MLTLFVSKINSLPEYLSQEKVNSGIESVPFKTLVDAGIVSEKDGSYFIGSTANESAFCAYENLTREPLAIIRMIDNEEKLTSSGVLQDDGYFPEDAGIFLHEFFKYKESDTYFVFPVIYEVHQEHPEFASEEEKLKSLEAIASIYGYTLDGIKKV